MTRDEFIETAGLEDGTIILEPWEEFSGGIVGVTEDRCHVVYDYDRMVMSLAAAWAGEAEDRDEEQLLADAQDWVDYNTLGYMPNWDAEHRPIIINMLPELS